jgi:dTDP-4-amino-4,6-dideoxygalactose transaminase
VPRRDEVVAHLKTNGIGCEIYYPVPAHLQECFAYLGCKEGDFPESEKAANEIMALPVYPELTKEMQDAVVDSILGFLK